MGVGGVASLSKIEIALFPYIRCRDLGHTTDPMNSGNTTPPQFPLRAPYDPNRPPLAPIIERPIARPIHFIPINLPLNPGE